MAQATPLERRLESAKTGFPEQKSDNQAWDIVQLRQSLQNDSAALENSLKEANKLMETPKNRPRFQTGTTSLEANKTFITALEGAVEEGTGGVPIVDGMQVAMSQRLSSRLSAMSQALGPEGMKLLQESVQEEMNKVCRIARETEKEELKKAGLALEGSDLQRLFQEEVKLRTAAQESNKLLQEQLRLQTVVSQEMSERLDALEGTTFEGGEELRKREVEMKSLKDEVLASQLKTRSEETERLKVLDRLRRKEVEMGKGKEVVDKLTIQLQKAGEERDTLASHLQDIKLQFHDLSQQNERLQTDLSRLQGSERVLRRNLQLEMPEEFRRVTRRVEDLERVNKEQEAKIAELEASHSEEAKGELVRRVHELTIMNKTLEERLEKTRKEKEAIERQWGQDTRVLANRGKQLFDKTVEYTQKLQGQVDGRIVERLKNRSSEKEMATLRKRNMELLGQVHSLDEAKATAEKTAREAIARSKTLQEKLDLFATLQRVELGKLQFGAAARTEDDVDLLFPAHASSHKPPRSRPPSSTPSTLSRPPSSRPLSSATRPPSAQRLSVASTRPASAATVRAAPLPEYTLRQRPTSAKTTYGGERPVPGIEGKTRPASAKTTVGGGGEGGRGGASGREGVDGSGEGPAGGGGEDGVGLGHAAVVLQGKLQAEEMARVAAQERVITLAEQLMEKEKEISRLQTQEPAAPTKGGKGGESRKKSERARELEAQNLAVLTKLRETEAHKEQLAAQLELKVEEGRVKGRKISDLLFRIEVLSESKARLEDEVAQMAQASAASAAVPRPQTGEGSGASGALAPKPHGAAHLSFAPPLPPEPESESEEEDEGVDDSRADAAAFDGNVLAGAQVHQTS